MKIGICGTGRMGTAMAERLISEGHQVVVWNRSPERAQAACELGAQWADSPDVMVGATDAIIAIVADEGAAIDLYQRPDGFVGGDMGGQLVIEMSTVTPAAAKRLAQIVESSGGAFVECPVSGTVQPAREGQLLGFAGGEVAAVERAKPVLDLLCRRHEHVGPVGSGAAMKLAVNLPLAIYWEALGEALSIAEAHGVDRQLAGDLLVNSTGAIPVAKQRVPKVLKVIAGEQPDPAAVTIAMMAKDVRLMNEVAADRGIVLPLAAVAREAYDEAARRWADRDALLLAAWRVLENRTTERGGTGS
jgi:3-hydroxyisobutyrate dehydrogenase